MMKALRFSQFGPPSALSLEEIERPVPAEGEVLVRVHAAAINPSDVKNITGVFHATLPRTPGRDYAGTVVSGGGSAWDGREVWGSGPGFGVIRDGAHAEFATVPTAWLSPKPEVLSMNKAAAIGVPYLVAWVALVDAARIEKGETILITGVSGAVGRAATQIARWKGARVIGVDRHDESAEDDHHINSETSDFVAETGRLTGGRGVDLVLDAVGGSFFEPSLRTLRRGGRQVAIASIGTPRVEFDLTDFYHELKSLIGVDSMKFTGSQITAALDELRTGFEQGQLTAPLVESWPLDQGVEAYSVVGNVGRHIKQVLRPG